MFRRVSSGRGPAAGDERQGRQPEQSPEAGAAGCGAGQQGGAAAGELDHQATSAPIVIQKLFANPTFRFLSFAPLLE